MPRIFILGFLFILVFSCSPSQTTSETEKLQEADADNQQESDSNFEESLEVSDLGPMESIKDLDKKVEAYHLGKNLSAEQIKENENLKREIIRGTFDIKELSRLALAKHWEEISKTQQKNFVSLMTRLLENKAIFSKEQLHGENKYYRIEYKTETIHTDKEHATVISKMFVPKRKIDLDLTYKMIKKPQCWKIYDVVVDDASLLTNYKYQFDRIIEKSGFTELIDRMEKRLKTIK